MRSSDLGDGSKNTVIHVGESWQGLPAIRYSIQSRDYTTAASWIRV